MRYRETVSCIQMPTKKAHCRTFFLVYRFSGNRISITMYIYYGIFSIKLKKNETRFFFPGIHQKYTVCHIFAHILSFLQKHD